MNSFTRMAALGVAGCLALTAAYAIGREAAPTDYRGVSQQVLAGIDLAGRIDNFADRELRLSRAVVEPGGHIGLHSHQGDPTIVYVLSGVLTNHHADGTTAEFGPGEVFTEFGPRAHWVENRGPAPVVFLAANLQRRK